jgi:hypothetical protein
MREPRSYIVRIYRQGRRSLTGVVEDTRTGGVRAFRTASQLLALLDVRIRQSLPPNRRG